MSQASTIQDFYKQVLTALSHRVESDDLITFVEPDGNTRPATVEGRRLVLPTKARLKSGFDDELQPFHPIAENIARKGASPVLANMQRVARALIAHNFTVIAENLLAVASEPSLHKDLPPECSEYLKKVPHADKKCLQNFQELVKKAVSKNALITLYLKNGGKLQGEKVNRLCVVRFPIMDHLEGDDDTVLGVKLRKKDKKTIAALLHYILPFGDDPEEYSAGSNSKVAPFLDAFLKAYLNVGKQINKLIHRYNKPLAMEMTPLELHYEESLEHLRDYYDKLPSLRGNEGSLTKGEEEEAASAPQPPAQPPQPGYGGQPQQPATPPPPPPTAPQQSGKSTISLDEFLGRGRQPQPAPVYNQPPQPPAYGYPQPPQPPMYNQAPPQPGYAYPQQPQAGYPQQGYAPPAPPVSAANMFGGPPQPPTHPFANFSSSVGGPAQPQNPQGGQLPPWETKPNRLL